MADQQGWEIKHPEAERGKFYPLVSDFKTGDAMLVERVTGLTWRDFIARLPDEDDDSDVMDAVVSAGLLAVAVAHVHDSWGRERVASYVEATPMAHVVWHEPDEAEVPVRPPAISAGETSSSSSPAESKPEPEPGSAANPRINSGLQDLATGSPV